MNEHQRESAFLQQCLRYDDTPDRHELEERMVELGRKERCVQRAVWLMALVITLAAAGLCYWAVLVPERPRNISEFITPFVSRGFCEVGLGALICLVAFLGLGGIYRRQFERRQEECRRMTTKLLESRLGPSHTPSSDPFVKATRVKTRETN
jgi:hypothetical protein